MLLLVLACCETSAEVQLTCISLNTGQRQLGPLFGFYVRISFVAHPTSEGHKLKQGKERRVGWYISGGIASKM